MSDLVESLANALVGLAVSWTATWWLLGYSPQGAAGVTAMFFGLSFARAWALRSIFRRLER